MPIAIDRKSACGLAAKLDDALEIVANEFDGLNTHRQYHNAFARVIKPDPLRRVLMMGTDQRDLFVPLLRRVIGDHVPPEGQIFDFGAGDGQTFGCVADSVPVGTMVSIEEPNPAYRAAYQAFLARQPHLRSGAVLEVGIDDIETGGLPAPASVDLALGLHMINFAADPAATLAAILRLVKPGGALFSVCTDVANAYTGSVLRTFVASGGEIGDSGGGEEYDAVIEQRRRLLAPAAEGGGLIAEMARGMGLAVECDSVRQPSRMYGHTLADLLAIANIGELANVPGTVKFNSAAQTLRDHSEDVDLRIETDGPRAGMWSVAQPQWVSRIRRL